jgi:hypothetical protein
VPVKLARQLFADHEPIPWPDVNLLAQWHLNSRRVPVPPILRDRPEHRREIRRWQALLPMHMCRDPAFDIKSLNWDMFSRWEVRPNRRASYLDDVDCDCNWEPVVSSDDEDSDEDEDDEAEDEDYEDEDDAKTPPPPRVSGEVSG